jgi:hypothetical protein
LSIIASHYLEHYLVQSTTTFGKHFKTELSHI